MRRGLTTALAVAALLAACSVTWPSPTPSVDQLTSRAPSPPASEAPASTGATDSGPIVVIDPPGRPYDGADILAAMRESRRPGGVPDQLETDAIATAVAEQVWTIGGEPWALVGIGGTCGAQMCDLEVGGSRGGVVGEDLYLFSVDLDDGSVTLLDSVLLGLDPETVEALDIAARERWEDNLSGYLLAAARWRAPPDEHRFELAYRSGGEEGSPQIDLILDVEAGTVEPMPASFIGPGPA